MEKKRVSKKVTATILSMSLLTVTPASHILFGSADLTGPYKVGIALCLLYVVQVYLTRHFQSLPPK